MLVWLISNPLYKKFRFIVISFGQEQWSEIIFSVMGIMKVSNSVIPFHLLNSVRLSYLKQIGSWLDCLTGSLMEGFFFSLPSVYSEETGLVRDILAWHRAWRFRETASVFQKRRNGTNSKIIVFKCVFMAGLLTVPISLHLEVTWVS